MFYTLRNRADTSPGAPYLCDTKTNNFQVF
jgi:hypothetical protein